MGARLTRPARALVFAASFALAVVASSQAVFRASDVVGREPPKLALDAVPQLAKKLEPLPPRAERGDARTVHVAFLGDSMLLQERRKDSLPKQVESRIRAAPDAPDVVVHEIGIPGSASFDYYYLVDEIAARDPDLVVIELNLTTLSATWRDAFARPQLAGLVSLSRVPEMLQLPVYWTGLTADRALAYAALFEIGALDAWTALAASQARVSNARQGVYRWLSGAAGAPAEERFQELRFLRSVRRDPGTGRFDAARERERFGVALRGADAGHPVLRALAATVRDFRRAGVASVVVYVNPANVDNLERVGVLDRAALDATLQSARTAVQSAGGRFSDLHALLPNDAFKDPAGHFTHGVEPDGAAIAARAIADVVADEAARIAAAR